MLKRRAVKPWIIGRSAGCSFILLFTLVVGCGSPSAANIELRKQQQTLQTQNNQLTEQHQRDLDALAACQRSHPSTVALEPEQLEKLVTTHGLKFGELTGGDNTDATKNFDDQLKVYIVPLDGDGIPIKAAGSFKVEAFDLDDPAKPLVGTWNFEPAKVRKLFYNQLLLYTYVLPCPWQTVPAHADLTVRVTFNDTLTGRKFVNQFQAKVRLADKKT